MYWKKYSSIQNFNTISVGTLYPAETSFFLLLDVQSIVVSEYTHFLHLILTFYLKHFLGISIEIKVSELVFVLQ